MFSSIREWWEGITSQDDTRPFSVSRYIWEVLSRSSFELWDLFESKPKPWLFAGLLGLIATWSSMYISRGRPPVVGDLVGGLVSYLAPPLVVIGGAVTLLFLLSVFVRVPRQIINEHKAKLWAARNERDEAKTQLAFVKNNSINQRQERLTKITELLHDGYVLRDNVPKSNASPDMVEAWKTQIVQWKATTATFLQTCSSVAALKFTANLGVDLNNRTLFNVHSSLAQSYDTFLLRLELLSEIIEKHDVYLG